MKDGIIDISAFEDLLHARKRIAPHIRRNPERTSNYFSKIARCVLFLNCETFQEPGALDLCGAANAVFYQTGIKNNRSCSTFLVRSSFLPDRCDDETGSRLPHNDAPRGATGKEGRSASLWRLG